MLRILIVLQVLLGSCLKKDRLQDLHTIPPISLDSKSPKEIGNSEELDTFKDVAKDIKDLANELQDKKIDNPELSQMIQEINNEKTDIIQENIESEEFIEISIAMDLEEQDPKEEQAEKESSKEFLNKLNSKETFILTGGTIVFISSVQYFAKLKSWYRNLGIRKHLRVKNRKKQAQITQLNKFADRNKGFLEKVLGKSFSNLTIKDLRAIESKNVNNEVDIWLKDLVRYLPAENSNDIKFENRSVKSVLDENLDDLKSLNQLDDIIYDKRLNNYFLQNKKFPTSPKVRDYLVEKVGTSIAEAQSIAASYDIAMNRNRLIPDKDYTSKSYSKRVSQVFSNDQAVKAQLKKVKNPIRSNPPLPKPTILSGAIAIIAGLSYANFSLNASSNEQSNIIERIKRLEERIWRLHFN
ncbi:MAG: hypothetical protein AB8G05_07385 [Oligoflexales bacterium]